MTSEPRSRSPFVRLAPDLASRCGPSFLLCSALLAQGPAAEAAQGPVEAARTAIERWVETKAVLSKEQRDWAEGKDVLQGRIAIVQRELEGHRARIADAEKSIAESDQKRAELAEERERLKAAAHGLEGTIGTLEQRTAALLKRVPDPLRERVKPLSQRMPLQAEATKLSLAERFQNVVGILNEIDKWNREITITSEVRTLSDGSAAEVSTMYLGIGQAWYVSNNGKVAGIGTAMPDGWAWRPVNEAAPRIAQAIAILKNEQVAAFVRLPVQVL